MKVLFGGPLLRSSPFGSAWFTMSTIIKHLSVFPNTGVSVDETEGL